MQFVAWVAGEKVKILPTQAIKGVDGDLVWCCGAVGLFQASVLELENLQAVPSVRS